MFKYIIIFLSILFIFCFSVQCQNKWHVKGYVIDSVNTQPIGNSTLEIEKLSLSVEADSSGYFELSLQEGEYILEVSAEGYKKNIRRISVGSNNTDLITINLFPSPYSTSTIDVYDEYFKKETFSSTSVSNYTYKEIYKTVGAVEDIIRYFRNTAGVSSENDEYNGLIVRGGAPTENLILIDGMELPNPNHFGPPGSSYGVLSYINLALINNVVFYTGGFPAHFGGKISSIMDIKFREGTGKKHSSNVNVSIIGFGGYFEGPLTKKGSYIFSIRRSYFELVAKQLNTDAFPNYWDLNYKLNYNFNHNRSLSLFGVAAWDKARPFEDRINQHKNADITLSNTGLKYSSTGRSGLFTLMLSHNFSKYIADYYGGTYFKIDVKDEAFSLKPEYTCNIDSSLFIKASANISALYLNYNVYCSGSYSEFGYTMPSIDFSFNNNKYKFSGSISLSTYLFKKKLQLNAGLRYDYFSLMNYPNSFSPRVGAVLKLTDKLFLNSSFGIFTQPPEVLWLIADSENRNLKYIKTNGYVLGAEYYFTKSLKLNVEGYYKRYYDYPVSVYDPYFIFINSGVSIYPNFLDKALSLGKGYYKGIDITLEKKNSGNGFYGQMYFSVSDSKFKSLYGNGQRGEFDYGKQFLIIAGYKINTHWAFGVRAKYSDGRPYTPYNIISYSGYSGYRPDKSRINTERLPYYLRFDARIDSYIDAGPLKASIYFELENVFDRKNVYIGYYHPFSDEKWTYIYQWSILPILGLNIKI